MTTLLLTALLSMPAQAEDTDNPDEVVEDETSGSGMARPEGEGDSEGEGEGGGDEVEPEPEPERWPVKWKGQVTEDMDHAHWDLEVLYSEGKFNEGLALAKKQVESEPDDKDYYWHIARFLFEVGEGFERTDTSIDKEAHYAEMREWCDKGLELAPNDPHLRFARGIAMGRLGTTRGVLASLFMANDIENDWLAAANSGYQYSAPNGAEIMPCDVYQALGIFYRLVPESWIVGIIAGTKGDLEKSVAYTEQGNSCAGGAVIRNVKEMAVSQICYGQKYKDPASVDKGIANLKNLITLTPEKETEVTDIKHGHMLIANPDLACEYSRDGQQDLDESKLEK